MYGKLNERKLHENDYNMSCAQTREELASYLNDQAKRVNIDSAKKRAVVQHMDYEGFRQMVLGANIFPTKSKQLYCFTKGEPSALIDGPKEEGVENEEKVAKKTEDIMALQRIHGKSEAHCFSFREFKKKFKQNYSLEMNLDQTLSCYNLLKQQNQQRLFKIFNAECQASIIHKIVKVFAAVISEMQRAQAVTIQQEAQFMFLFFKSIPYLIEAILQIPTMKPMTICILSKKEREQIVNFLNDLKAILNSEEQLQQLTDISNTFTK